jgi:hypothetical protein
LSCTLSTLRMRSSCTGEGCWNQHGYVVP